MALSGVLDHAVGDRWWAGEFMKSGVRQRATQFVFSYNVQFNIKSCYNIILSTLWCILRGLQVNVNLAESLDLGDPMNR